METQVLERKFADLGARVKFNRLNRFANGNFRINVGRDGEGEFFDIQSNDGLQIDALDVQKKDRHLLLMVKEKTGNNQFEKNKYLCGHDERHWFSAAIPEGVRVSSVNDAKQALKPSELISIERRLGIKTKNLHKRHRKTEAGLKIHRQGEFMFVPDYEFKPTKDTVIHENEPLTRGAGKPHMAQFLCRRGGTQVYVNSANPTGITAEEYARLPSEQRKHGRYRMMVRDPRVVVKGKIKHSDHATVDLRDLWHRVMVNTERSARGQRFNGFLD
jgi:hypothetical protein